MKTKRFFKTFLFWLVTCTWGGIMNLIGIFGCIAMLIMGEKPKRFGTCVYFTHGRRWGGVCLGGFFFVSEDSNTLYTKAHESGHAIQNMILGPLFPFVVGIPSMIRYHLFGKQNNKQKQKLAIMLCSIAGAIGALLVVLGAVFNLLPILIIGAVCAVYVIVITIWLFCFELINMSNSNYGYYDIWFEGGASKNGMKIYQANKDFLRYE